MDKKCNLKTNCAIGCFVLLCFAVILVWHFCFFSLAWGERDDQFTFLGFAKDMFSPNGIGWLRAQLIYLLLLCLPIPFYLILIISLLFKFNAKLYVLASISIKAVLILYSTSAVMHFIYYIITSSIAHIYETLLVFSISILVGCAFFAMPAMLFSLIKSRQIKTDSQN